MKRRPTVIVFAKAPRFGAVKTRLAQDIGALAAWRFQRNQISAILRDLSRDRRWRLVLAVTPDDLTSRFRFDAPEVARLPQGRGDLGTRMARTMSRFLPAPVLLVGSDIPALAPEHLAAALKTLATNEVVFGRAPDGGYWLIGIRGRLPPHTMFRDVQWSTAQALEDTRKNIRPGLRIGFCATLDDVDTGSDIARISTKD